MTNNQISIERDGPFNPQFQFTTANTAATVYLTDLPRNTSYIDLAEIFEKTIGPCSIQIKRYLF